MSKYDMIADDRFVSYKELKEHAATLTAEQLAKPILCMVENEEKCFPIKKFINVENNRIELETCQMPSNPKQWKTWNNLTEYINSLSHDMLNFWVFISTPQSNYRICEVTQTKYPDGFMSDGQTNFNILVIDYNEFYDEA